MFVRVARLGSLLGVFADVFLRDLASARRNIRKQGESECTHDVMKLDARRVRYFFVTLKGLCGNAAPADK